MRYRQQYDGEWFRPRMKKWFMRCCDCGSVHIVNFKIVNENQKYILMQVFKK